MGKDVYTKNDTYDLIARFAAGWYAEKPNCSVTGIGNTFPAKYAREGTIVVDGEACEYAAVCDFSIKGPMRDLKLPVNSFQPLLGTVQNAEGKAYAGFRSLDTVSLDIWLAEARRIGARVGIFTNGAVSWYAGFAHTPAELQDFPREHALNCTPEVNCECEA